MKRFIGSILFSVVLFSFVFPINGFAKENDIKLAKQSTSAILMEESTGKILYNKNADKKLPPASMTKVMTMLLIMEALEDGKLSYNQKIRTSDHASSMGGSQIYLEEGEVMSVKEMLLAVAIGSANDASVA